MRIDLPFVVPLMVAVGAAACQPPPAYDLIVRGGTLIDGTGAPARRADVAVRGDRIVAVGDLSDQSSGYMIEAAGLVVAPGFIDVQGRSGTTLLADGNGESHVRQGVTSEIIGDHSPAFWTPETAETGLLERFSVPYDWTDVAGYFGVLSERGIALNLGTLVSATQVRQQIVGPDDRAPSAPELGRMRALVDQAMRDGAFGLSSSLIDPPGSFAGTAELRVLAEVAGAHGGIYATHIRGESVHLFPALDEAIAIGRDTGIPVVIRHLKVAGRENWGRMAEVIQRLNAANADGVRVLATMYPYAAGAAGLAASLPPWVHEGGREAMLRRLADPAVRARVRQEIESTVDRGESLIGASMFAGIQVASVPPGYDPSVVGRRMADISSDRGEDPCTTFFDLLVQSRGQVEALYYMMSEDDVRTALQWGSTSIGSDSAALRADGALAGGAPHPSAYGTFPRVLGAYVRDAQVLPLVEAVRRMTSLAAAQFGIDGRGVVRTGLFADLVVFDPATVSDRATYAEPHQYPEGIRYVIVNGVPVLDPRGLTGARPGRVLYGRGYATR